MYPGPDPHRYAPESIRRYLRTLTWRRRILAFLFDRYRVSRREYDEWYNAERTRRWELPDNKD